jgi:DNA-binding CsgD family transcriptional regulator
MMPVSMVGRDGELGELVDAWSRVESGVWSPAPGRTAVITGAAGIGKTLLVRAALDAFDPRPGVVLYGRARVHSPAPYDWLAAVLSERAASSGYAFRPEDWADVPVPPDALAWLAQHPDAPPYRYAPGALLRLAVRTVRALVGAGPAVIVVEDLHALDPASLNMVAELAAPSDLPALLIVTSQPPDVAVSPKLAARTLARLTGVRGVVRQHLDVLTADDVAGVLAQVYQEWTVSPAVAEAVWGHTDGNPYHLIELLATRRGAGPERLVAGAPRLAGAAPRAGGAAPRDNAAAITAREWEVLDCLAAGMSNKQVARSLGISIRTVTVHVSNLLRKTRSASRTEAALWAVRHQVPDVDDRLVRRS